MADLTIAAVEPTSAPARAAMRAYIRDVADRYYERPATSDEIDAGLAEHPTDDLVPPYGVLLVATDESAGEVCGCIALARVPESDGVGEVRRLPSPSPPAAAAWGGA
ncbi:MAG: hypothetical protein FWE71_03055 [Nocardioidaceae bacterium]|nr:hypothetical protein [Nocardioidaceae bacterium]MCL2615158.1 hypothetical protein [Nocardioidaceae bacterium]